MIKKKNEEERMRIGQRIEEIRKQRGMTQIELAERSGLNQGHIARLEQGHYGATLDVLAALAEALGKKIDFVKL